MLAHIVQVNKDENILGGDFDEVVNLLVKVDPVAGKTTTTLKKRNNVQVSAILAGQDDTGVDFC